MSNAQIDERLPERSHAYRFIRADSSVIRFTAVRSRTIRVISLKAPAKP